MMMLKSLKTMYAEIRYPLAALLIATDALVGGMVYSGATFTPVVELSDEGGLVFTKLTNTLYSMIGGIEAGDCERIVSDLPTQGAFTVLLESPGGNLAEGACLAAHLKVRDVITVVRDTEILSEDGGVLYSPGEVSGDGKTVCASACSLLFLGGDKRFLIGNVYLGIHAPRTPEGSGVSPSALEASAYRTAAALLKLLKDLGVEGEDVRNLFIQVPAATMYFLNPKDFKGMPELILLATHYKDFWGFDAENPMAEL
jgi:hypothetical protein